MLDNLIYAFQMTIELWVFLAVLLVALLAEGFLVNRTKNIG